MDGIMHFIYKHSKSPFFSVIIFIGIEFFTLSFTALRQMIALAIIVNSYSFIKENKPIKFVLMVLLASLFHKTALVFLVAYLFKYIKINRKAILIGFISLLLMQIIGFDLIINIVKRIYPYYIPKDIVFTSNGLVQGIVILVYLLIGIYLYYFQIDKSCKEKDEILYIIMFVAFFIQTFANRIPMINRIMWYFYIFAIIFLPNQIFKVIKPKVKTCFGLVIILLCLTQYFVFSMNMYNVVPYKFFIN